MHIVEGNLAKNRIYLKMAGYLTDVEIQEVAEKFKSEVRKMKPGIDVINDISEFRPATASGAEIIKEAQKYLAQHGVGRVVRIVNDRVSGLLQFSTTGKQAGLEGVIVHTLEEAQKLLDEPK